MENSNWRRSGNTAEQSKFAARRDRALANIVLSVDISLLYLINDPTDPVAVWGKLAGQFKKKTWETRLNLPSKLYALQMKDGESAQTHIKVMSELFDSLICCWRNCFRGGSHCLPPCKPARVLQCFGTALEANEGVSSIDRIYLQVMHYQY